MKIHFGELKQQKSYTPEKTIAYEGVIPAQPDSFHFKVNKGVVKTELSAWNGPDSFEVTVFYEKVKKRWSVGFGLIEVSALNRSNEEVGTIYLDKKKRQPPFFGTFESTRDIFTDAQKQLLIQDALDLQQRFQEENHQYYQTLPWYNRQRLTHWVKRMVPIFS